MRHLTAVLRDCKSRAMHLNTNDDGLEVHGPLDDMPRLREELRLHKPNILIYLKTGWCHQELESRGCKMCNGYVRRLVEQGMSREWARAEVLGHSQPVDHTMGHWGDPRT
jgi:hypothetical protein